MWRALERLHHTFVETNIRMDNSNRHHSFNWLSEIKQVKDGNTHKGYEIVIPDWLYESVVEKKIVLTLDDDYFKIRGGLERWLYLFARKSSGYNTGGWSEGLFSIYQKSGSKSSFSEFKRSISAIIKRGGVLGYKISPISYKRQKGLYFIRDNELVELTSQKRQRRGANKWRMKGQGYE